MKRRRISTLTTLLSLMLAIGALVWVGATLAADPEETALYEQAMDALDREQYRKAIDLFDRVADAGGRRTDGALYWMAYSMQQRGQIDDALETLRRLQREHPESRWIDESRALSSEMRSRGTDRAADIDVDVDTDDVELKLLALEGLLHSDPDRALPMLEKMVRGKHDSQLKEHALFLLLQSGDERGMRIAADIARSESEDPDLRQDAVEALSIFGGEASIRLLDETFASTRNEDVRESVLEGYMIAGRKDKLAEVLRSDASSDIREQTIEYLGALGAVEELEPLYRSEKSEEAREAYIEAFMMAGRKDLLLDAAESDPSEDVRSEAVEMLGVLGAGDELYALYEKERSAEVRENIVEGLMIMGDAGRLLEIARTDASEDVRAEAVEMLGVIGHVDDLRQLYEGASPDLRENIVEALGIAGDVEFLADVARGNDSADVRAEAVEMIGVFGKGRDSAKLLRSLYDKETDPEVREAALEALFIRGDARELIDIAQTEKDRELKLAAVRHLSVMRSDEATRYMQEILDED